jgi:hypothetical protein
MTANGRNIQPTCLRRDFYLRRRIETEPGGQGHCDLDGFDKRVVSNYVASLDYAQPWAQRYRHG